MTALRHPPDPSPVRPKSGSRLRADAVSLGYDGRRVVDDLTLAVPDGRVTVVVGANACGKSTLLRGLARLLRAEGGAVLLDGRDIHDRPTREVARTLGLLPQTAIAPEGVTVVDLVARGRHPHRGLVRRWSDEDDRAVAEALTLTGTLDLAQRPVDELSGGQRQRVWVAMVLAQRTDLLLLDEPTTFLDLAHQVELLDVLADLNAARGTTVVMVLHELNLAARYADHLVAMKDGRVVAAGDPREVVTEELVHDVFGLQACVVPDPVTGTPLVVPATTRRRPLGTPAPPTQEDR
ncbi:ABC transporter ATP-binding protein [Nocardioides sp. Y6]|uniref:ABC transporter ATP-binding protein n=1 Tax=Nocardioides malaquae TaxID=2773426 RepID=A0ABR9RW41_9ACTN|nr:ABC transporter ATP-binding protein [Nocardioides malaquae]MBE7325794.1 ABC transporter ATP-binding protein [Nocardioides malaquae]